MAKAQRRKPTNKVAFKYGKNRITMIFSDKVIIDLSKFTFTIPDQRDISIFMHDPTGSH